MGSWEFLVFYHVTGLLAGLASLGIFVAMSQFNVDLLAPRGRFLA